jgi:phage shock protein A
MNIYSKLRTLMISKAEQPIRHIVNSNDMEIFEQEIKSAQSSVRQSKLYLASIKADAAMLRKSIQELRADIHRLEAQTLEAIDKDEELALDLAKRIAEEEGHAASQSGRLTELTAIEEKASKDLQRAVQAIKSYQNRLIIVKANERRGATYSASQHGSIGLNGCLLDLSETLQSIQQRQLRDQSMDEALLQVDADMSTKNLEDRVIAAGISTGKPDGKAVLDRIKKGKLAFT